MWFSYLVLLLPLLERHLVDQSDRSGRSVISDITFDRSMTDLIRSCSMHEVVGNRRRKLLKGIIGVVFEEREKRV